MFLCHQPLVNHGGSRFYLLLLYSQPRHSQGHPVISLTKTEEKKGEKNLLATLRDSNLKATEMAHIARESLLQEATAMLSGNASSASYWLSLKWLVSKSRLWFDLSPDPQRQLWATVQSCDYWATADGGATVIFISFLTCQVSQNVIHKGC